MKRIILPLLMLFLTGAAHAQEISADELLSLKKMDSHTIDSFLQTKGYHRQVLDPNDITIRVYTWTGATSFGQPAMRSVHIGRPPGRKSLDVEYGVWQKADAQRFIRQLESAGFKKRTSTAPDMGGGGASFTQVDYRKDNVDISYREEAHDGVTAYIFNVD
jgi:hypothetical protein